MNNIRGTPLTTEEQAVLVAINPENELLYRNVGSARPAEPTAERSATDSSGAANDEASTWDVDSNNNEAMTTGGDHTSAEVQHLIAFLHHFYILHFRLLSRLSIRLR